jgi:hypothetical protein
MKNILLLAFALILIGAGIFLGLGIRTKANLVEKPHELTLSENRS